MEITKEEKDFIAKAIECYWDVWNIDHSSNVNESNASDSLVKKLNLHGVIKRSELLQPERKCLGCGCELDDNNTESWCNDCI